MGKKWLIIGVLLLILVVVGYVAIPRYVKVTGPVIWVDQSWSGGWDVDSKTGDWWEQMSKLSPALDHSVSYKVIVFLLPTLQTSQNALGQKDKPSIAYIDWRPWSKNINVMTVSINWEQWEQTDPSQRNIRFNEFVATRLGTYWRAPDKKKMEMIAPIISESIKSPVSLIGPMETNK